MSEPTVTLMPSPEVPFTERDRQMLHEIHAAIVGIGKAIESFPLDKLSKSPVLRMLGL